MEVIYSYETSVDFHWIIRRYIISDSKWCVSGICIRFYDTQLNRISLPSHVNFLRRRWFLKPLKAAHTCIILTRTNSRFICFSCMRCGSFSVLGERTRLLFNIHMTMEPACTNRVSHKHRSPTVSSISPVHAPTARRFSVFFALFQFPDSMHLLWSNLEQIFHFYLILINPHSLRQSAAICLFKRSANYRKNE
jgi:hypothetical protein